MNNAVRLAGVVKRFGQTVAVDGLDLVVRRGEVLALLGPNGAGKTTTIELCQGLTAPDEGVVEILGEHPSAESLRPRIGFMPQGGGGYPGAKAGELLRVIAAQCAEPLDVDWLLDVLGIAQAKNTSFRRLSGGQQQRLSLACALVGRPELVFLDEPTAGLDVHARRLVWDLVEHLRADGVTVLLTTHLIEEAEHLADRVVIVANGKEVASGSPATLVSSAQKSQLRFTARAGLDLTGLPAHELRPGEYAIDEEATPQLVARLAGWLAERDVLAHQIRVQGGRLEDVFLELTETA
jgi:ABC-2 type transport system ATP-binding protein